MRNFYVPPPEFIFYVNPKEGLPSIGKLYSGSLQQHEFIVFRYYNWRKYVATTLAAIFVMGFCFSVSFISMLNQNFGFPLNFFMFFLILVSSVFAVRGRKNYDLSGKDVEARLLNRTERELLRTWAQKRYNLNLTPENITDLLNKQIVWLTPEKGITLTTINGYHYITTIVAEEEFLDTS